MNANGFQTVIKDDASLKLFVKKLVEFDSKFCALMMKGSDFTLRLDVRGNAGEVLHVRLYEDDIERPPGAQKRIDAKVE